MYSAIHSCIQMLFLVLCRVMIHFRMRQLSKLFYLPLERGATLKGKNLLPLEQILSFYSRPLFRRGLHMQERKQEVTRVVSHVQAENYSVSIRPLKANAEPKKRTLVSYAGKKNQIACALMHTNRDFPSQLTMDI